MSLMIDTDSIDDLIQQLRFHVTSSGKPYLEQLENVIKWSSRLSAARQLGIIVSSGMSKPLEVKSALRYIERITNSQFTPSSGQARVKDSDIRHFFALANALYDAGLWSETESHLDSYPLIFPMSGDKQICGHHRGVCECGYVHADAMDAYCQECSRPRTLCTKPALANGRCVDHGGRLPEGRSKGSIYRQYMDSDMADTHARLEGEGNLSLDAEIGIAVTAIARLSQGGVNMTAVKRIRQELNKAIEQGDTEGVLAHTAALENALSGTGGGETSKELREWLNTLARLTSQERESRKTASEYIHIDDHAKEIDELVAAFRTGMDRSYDEMRKMIRQSIEEEMSRTPGDSPSSIASRVVRTLLDNQQIIESYLLEPYRRV